MSGRHKVRDKALSRGEQKTKGTTPLNSHGVLMQPIERRAGSKRTQLPKSVESPLLHRQNTPRKLQCLGFHSQEQGKLPSAQLQRALQLGEVRLPSDYGKKLCPPTRFLLLLFFVF